MKKGYVALFQFAESFNIVGSHWDDEGRKQDDYEQHKRRRFCHRMPVIELSHPLQDFADCRVSDVTVKIY